MPLTRRGSGLGLMRRRCGLAMVRCLAVLIGLMSGFALPAGAADLGSPADDDDNDDHGAVIFAYNRFGEDAFPSASIRLDQFEAHIAELTSGDYTVMPLNDIVAALRDGKVLPERTVAITIDESYASVYQEAFPRLRAAHLPFTLFVSTDAIDRGGEAQLTWREIREMAGAGATIGSLAASPESLPSLDEDEAKSSIERAERRLTQELGTPPALFAYPYGEYSRGMRDLVAGRNYAAALAQNSGVAYHASDRFALPRFVMNESFGGIDRFRLAANALPLPVRDVTPADPELTESNPPNLGFTLPDRLANKTRLACFASGQGRANVEWLDDRVEVRIPEAFPPGRARVNCTLPADDGRWRWFGIQFFVPD
ncbi:MAG: polysaccharide deacetylase family protein [Azospirillaceae bacterium]|nr:polysaccharide deacetylase family protein [Azospirillaceae bacterium]